MGLDYFPNGIIATLPRLYVEIAEAFEHTYNTELAPRDIPTMVKFGSWIGGDRDGNPYVTPDNTRHALSIARQTILASYVQSVDNLIEALSASRQQRDVSPALLEALAGIEQEVRLNPAATRIRATDEIYRRFLVHVGQRLRAAAETPPQPGAYQSAAEFERDLSILLDSLIANGGERLAEVMLDPLLRQVRTFGFHLHVLDIRQHARIHARGQASSPGPPRLAAAGSPPCPHRPPREHAILLTPCARSPA